MRFLHRILTLCSAIAIVTIGFTATAQAQYSAPRVFFTDLQSGPNTGGQDNQGTIVTVYGKGFGSTQGSSSVSLGGRPVYRYLSWSASKIAFQIGNNAATGNIVVSVAGSSSNGLPFTVRAGNIYFVSGTGNDNANGSYATPWLTLAKAKTTMSAGDVTYVMNGVSATGSDKYGASLAITRAGRSGAPMALVAYPGATVKVGSASGQTYGIRASSGSSYWVFAGLTVSGASDALDSSGATGWRLVGNDISCPNGSGSAACVNGRKSSGTKLLGNNVHDVGLGTSSDLANYEAVSYSASNNVEVGWNNIGKVQGCRAVLFYTANAYQSGLTVHDNLIHDVRCDAITFGSVDPSAGSVRAFNNVVARAGTGPAPGGTGGLTPTYACVRVNGSGAGQAVVANNTLYDCGAAAGGDAGAIAANTPTQVNGNIVDVQSAEEYVTANTLPSDLSGSNNLFYGNSSAAPAPFTSSVQTDPQIVNPANLDFHLQATSPAIDAGVNTGITSDYDGVPRPQGQAFDIGAFEYSGPAPAPSAGQIAANPASIDFGSVVVGSSNTQSVAVSNTGTANATISSVNTTGSGFSVAPVILPMTLTPGQVATFVVTFKPAAAGTTSGSLVVTSNASNSTFSVQLTGTATNPSGTLSASTTSVNFGTVTVGSSGTQSLTVSAATSSVTISQATIGGTGASNYSISGLTLPATIAAGQSATFQLKFAPSTSGSLPATLTLTSNASNSPLTINLSGSGASVTGTLSASTTTLSFGTVGVGSSATQSVTLSAATASVTVSQATLSGTGATSYSITGVTLPVTIAAGQSVTLQVKFAPTAGGSLPATLSLASNASNSTTSIALSGTGAHSVTLNWSASSSSGVTGYNVYRSTTSGGPYTKLTSTPVNGTSYVDSSVAAGTTYYYVVTAVTSSGESSYSSQASAAVSTP